MTNGNGNESDKLHGEPLRADPRSNEHQIEGVMRTHIVPEFYLDLRAFGGPLMRIKNPPARIIDRVMAVLVSGPKALNSPPENPQPNDQFGKLLPPPESGGQQST